MSAQLNDETGFPAETRGLSPLKIFKTSSMLWCIVMHSDNFAFT